MTAWPENTNHFLQAVERPVQILQHIQTKATINARVSQRDAFNGGNKPELNVIG
jgi:hypothetical protein